MTKRMKRLMAYTALPMVMAAASGCANINGGIYAANQSLQSAMYGGSGVSYSQMDHAVAYSSARRQIVENDYEAARYGNALTRENAAGRFSGFVGFMEGLGNAGHATAYAGDGVSRGAAAWNRAADQGAKTVKGIHDALHYHSH
jgi:hypothetical protein